MDSRDYFSGLLTGWHAATSSNPSNTLWGIVIPDLKAVTDRIVSARRSAAAARSILVALTGIDGCGKTFISAPLVEALQRCRLHTVVLHVDGWLNLPARRFDPSNPAEHFYLNAIRFEEMFSQLVLPLRDQRSVRCEVDEAEETATAYRKRLYAFDDVDVIVLEGIYLLKQAFQSMYDCSCWIDCSFETALQRAIDRAQEGMPPDRTVRAYRTIYFPAQQIHFERDHPKSAATVRIDNDSGPACADDGGPTDAAALHAKRRST